MIDFITIDESVFQAHKPAIDENDSIVMKITKMLEGYDCFNESVVLTHHHHHNSSNKGNHKHNFRNNHHKRNEHHQNRNENVSHNCPHHFRKFITNSSQTSNDRITTTLLNKLSQQNYKKISEQIIKHLDKNNIKRFVDLVLEKCQRQSIFLDLYIDMLYDIYNKHFNEMRQIIHETLLSYINDYMKQRDFMTDFELDSEDYDTFCNNVDNKKQIIGKHKTILAVVMRILKCNMVDDYFKVMFDEIITMDEKSHTLHDHERHELMLDILADFVKADIKYRAFVEKYYSNNTHVLNNYTSKAKFKVMDIRVLPLNL
jgi:hypothetical protein